MHTRKLVICVGVLVSIGMLICYCLPVPSPFVPALAELQQADLITSKECEDWSGIHDLVRAQRSKSPEVKSKTANILRRHGFEEKSRHLAGT